MTPLNFRFFAPRVSATLSRNLSPFPGRGRLTRVALPVPVTSTKEKTTMEPLPANIATVPAPQWADYVTAETVEGHTLPLAALYETEFFTIGADYLPNGRFSTPSLMFTARTYPLNDLYTLGRKVALAAKIVANTDTQPYEETEVRYMDK